MLSRTLCIKLSCGMEPVFGDSIERQESGGACKCLPQSPPKIRCERASHKHEQRGEEAAHGRFSRILDAIRDFENRRCGANDGADCSNAIPRIGQLHPPTLLLAVQCVK